MEYDPIKDKLFAITRGSTFLRESLFCAIGKLFLREAYVKRHIKRMQLQAGNRVLDAGCGLGQYSLWMASQFPGVMVEGGDVKAHFTDAGNVHAKARNYTNLQFRYLDLLEMTEQEQYDVIVAVDIMEHIEDDVDVMRRLKNALKKGGRLLIHTPGSNEDSRHATVDPKMQVEEHVRVGYLPAELEDKLKIAGFSEVALHPTYHPVTGTWLWYLWQYVPLHLTRLGKLGFVAIPLYLLVAYPVGYPLWWRDLHLPLSRGNGVLAVAKK